MGWRIADSVTENTMTRKEVQEGVTLSLAIFL
jgi:hypothetical protein